MCRNSATFLLIILALSSVSAANATSLRIHVEDRSGAALKDELVIVQPLEKYGENFRLLSDDDGNIPSRNLAPGFYRLIVTDPYGIWQTNISEFAVGTEPVSLQVTVSPGGTHGFGDRVPLWPKRFLKVEFVDGTGRPLPGVEFLVRNEDLDFASWYTSDASGSKTVQLPTEPITIVAIWKGGLTTKVFDNKFVEQLHGKNLIIRLD